MTDVPDESNSSRLNRLSVARLRERFGDTSIPALPAELLNARVRFWMCINREHKSVVWDDDVARCPDCGVTSKMTTRYRETIRTFERERIAGVMRVAAGATQDDGAGSNEPLVDQIWNTCARDQVHPAVVEDPRTIAYAAYMHLADRIERGDL